MAFLWVWILFTIGLLESGLLESGLLESRLLESGLLESGLLESGLLESGVEVYKSGDDGYQCFRIPAIVKTNKNTLLAFAEARKKGCGDAGDIDLVLKRSVDAGRSWSAISVIWDDGGNTCGNPAPVVDRRTGDIVLLSTWNLGADHEAEIINGASKDSRRIFVLRSGDDGASWTKAREITADVKRTGWTWYATGPVNGIQLRSKKFKGRLLIPCDHIEAGTKKYFSHVIYSDDGGQQWKLGGSTPSDQVNECTVAELPGGQLLLNMRNYNSQRVRQISTSMDGGLTWSALQPDTNLVEPVCQASLIWYNHKGRKPCLAFSNPASGQGRTNMTLKISYDQGRSWSRGAVLHKGPSAYSNLVTLSNGNLACLFEAGIKTPYESILFREINFRDLK